MQLQKFSLDPQTLTGQVDFGIGVNHFKLQPETNGLLIVRSFPITDANYNELIGAIEAAGYDVDRGQVTETDQMDDLMGKQVGPAEAENKPKRKGLIVQVYRTLALPDASAGGVTSQKHDALLIGQGVEEVSEEMENLPVLEISSHRLENGDVHYYVVPTELKDKSPLKGGNFIYSSDSRFPSRQPLPVHDRIELGNSDPEA